MTARLRWTTLALAVVAIALATLRCQTASESKACQPRERVGKSEGASHPPEPRLIPMRPTLRSLPALPPVRIGYPPIEVEADPNGTNYDAYKLYAVTNVSAAEMFKHEPRNDAWASDRERIVGDLTLSALRMIDPDVKVATECHTGVCKVSIHSRKFFNVGVFGPYPFHCIAEHATPAPGPGISPEGIDPNATDPYSDVYLFFGQKTHDINGDEVRERCAGAQAWFEDRLELYRSMTEVPW